MLHVQRLKGRLALVWRAKERGFSSDLFKGLMIALALHLFFISLFQVGALSTTESLAPLSPISVETDLSSGTLSLPPVALSPIEKINAPEALSLIVTLPKNECFYSECACQDPDFSSIETIDYQYLNIDFDDDQD